MPIIRKPIIQVSYENVNITNSITRFIKSFKYHDKLSGDSPSIDLTLEDSERLWQNEWFPETGARLSFTLKYEDLTDSLTVNNFEIDTPSFTFSQSGDVLKLGGQQTPFSKNLREERSQEYENTTLKAVVDLIATRQQLTVKGVVPEISFERLTQNEESDLQFLTRIAQDYGHLFKVEGDNLIVYTWDDINSQPSSFSLDRTTITRFSPKKKLHDTYKEAHIVYEKTDDEKTIDAIIPATRKNNSEDVLTVNVKAETPAQAEAIAKEKLRKANADEYSGDLVLEGDSRYLAGINFDVSGFGEFDGKWQIQEAEHSFSPSGGWVSRLTVYRLD